MHPYVWYIVYALGAVFCFEVVRAIVAYRRDKWSHDSWLLTLWWKWFSGTGAAKERWKNIGRLSLAAAMLLILIAVVGYSLYEEFTTSPEEAFQEWSAQVPAQPAGGATADARASFNAALHEWLARDPRLAERETMK